MHRIFIIFISHKLFEILRAKGMNKQLRKEEIQIAINAQPNDVVKALEPYCLCLNMTLVTYLFLPLFSYLSILLHLFILNLFKLSHLPIEKKLV